MKKRILSGLLLTATVAVGFSTFTSCKDTDEDLRTEFTSQQMSLETALAKLKADVDKINSCTCPPAAQLPDLDKWFQDNKGTVEQWIDAKIKSYLFEGDKNILTDLSKEVEGLQTDLSTLGLSGLTPTKAAEFAALVPRAQEILTFLDSYSPVTPGEPYDDTQIKADILKLQGDVTNIEDLINGNPEKEIVGLLSQVATNTTDISEVKGDVSGLTSTVNGHTTDISNLQLWFKDINLTAPQFQEYVKLGEWVKNNSAAMDALNTYIEGKKEILNLLDKAAIEDLNTYHKQFENMKKMYDTLFPAGIADEKEWWSYEEVMTNIQENQEAIKALKEDIEKLYNIVDNMVTSLVLQTTANPLFGSIYTPFGINSMVLMSYYGNLTTDLVAFPISNHNTEYCGENMDPVLNAINWSSMLQDASKEAYNPVTNNGSGNLIATNDEGLASLGTLWFTVNPATVAKLDGTFSVVNSIEKESPITFEAVPDNETVFKFGLNRSTEVNNVNGLYKAEAFIDPTKLDDIKINIQPELKDALVSAVKDHSATDIASMLKYVYYQLMNVCDANALRYSWNSFDSKNEDGTWNMKENKVYTNYGLAVTAFKPLSFKTLYGTSISKRIPTFNNIEINKDLVKLDLGNFTVDSKDFNLSLNFGSPEFNQLGNLTVDAEVNLKDGLGNDVSGTVTVDITKKAEEIQANFKDAINNWIGVDGKDLDARVDEAVWKALFNDPNAKDPKYAYDPSMPVGVVTDLIAQVNDMTGKIQDKLNNAVDKVNKDYLSKVNSFLGKVNKVSNKINNVLADPNHYLQAMMMYKDAAGNFHMLSTNPKQPSQFRGDGEAIELFATTYSFETVCPVFKKFIGVDKVTTPNGTVDAALKKAANNPDNYMANVIAGDHQRVVLDVKGAKNGVYTYEIAYQALDYHGYTSTKKCYIQVIR